ncbi:hypothetical protein B0H11DRAFT_1996418 [Mycena galericulata]|nr:hypothetical protein B0H11DRAFT_1996418 [Mycena galericulata]
MQPLRKTVHLVMAPVAQVDSSPRRIRPHTSSTPGRHAPRLQLGNDLQHLCPFGLPIAQRRWRQRPAKSCVGCVGERIRILAEQLALDRRCARVILGSLRMRRACLWPGRYIQRRTSVENRRTPWSTYRRCKTWYSVPARSPAPALPPAVPVRRLAVPALLTVAPLHIHARRASPGDPGTPVVARGGGARAPVPCGATSRDSDSALPRFLLPTCIPYRLTSVSVSQARPRPRPRPHPHTRRPVQIQT